MKENNARAVKARDKNMARFWEWIADLPDTLRAAYSPGAVVRVGVPPALLADAVAKIRGVADNLKIDPHLFSHAAIASIYVGWSGEDAQVIEAIKHLRWALAGASVEAFNQTPLHASVVVESASSAVKSAIDVWGLDGAEVKLMRAIKERFDPNWIFNPGRFVGGL
jgi:FAD/FMN-containing dehydrogenase